MSTLTMKPKQVKEPRQKRQLAPVSVAREIHEAKPEPEWRTWPLEGLRAFVVSVVSRQLPRVVTAAQKCSDATAAEVVDTVCSTFVSSTEPNGLTVRSSSIGMHLLGPDFKEIAKFSFAELVTPFRQCLGPSPDETGTSTPAGIAANDLDAVRSRESAKAAKWAGSLGGAATAKKAHTEVPGREEVKGTKEVRNFGSKTTSKVSLKNCERHPANQIPALAEVDDIAASIQKEGLLEKPVLRPIAAGKFQIVSGETRVLAMRKLGWHETDAELVQCDDARALELLAIYNAKRRNLHAIEKARMIRELCKPIAEGGAGKTREEAARIYKLESHSAASNLVRLLELPQVWQDRVASGELPESFARMLLPVVNAPRLLEELEKSWRVKDRNDEDWASRERVEVNIDHLIHRHTRPVDGEKYHYGYTELQRMKDPWKYSGDYKRLFELTPEIEAKLEIVELQLDKKKMRLATNVAAYDKLQIPLIKTTVEAKAKTSAAKSGGDKPAKKHEPTAAEKREAAAAKTRQLSERIAAWRHKLLRRACAQAIEDEQDSGLRLVLAHAAELCVPHGGMNFTEALQEVRKVQPRKRDYHDEYWPLVASISDATAVDDDSEDTEGKVVAKLAQVILGHESKDWRRPTVPHSLVESYAADLAVDVKAEWIELQRDELTGEPDPLLEEFFLLHQTDQLRELALKELDVFVTEAMNKPAMVRLLLAAISGGNNRRLPLPKSVKPVGKKGGK